MSAAPVKKACDACHRRKVRCSGGQPCKGCDIASLQCTYLAVPQKKGPKGSRAKVISEIRDNQQQTVKSPTTTTTTSTTTKSSHDTERDPFDFNTSPISPGLTRNFELLSPQTVDGCIAFYFSHMYPTMPIFSRQKLSELANNYRDSKTEVYCLMATLCAFMMIQPGMTISSGSGSPDSYEIEVRTRHASLLLEEVKTLRKSIDYVENPTIHSVQTSFFLFASYFSLERSNACWFHIREATTLAQILLMHEEASYHTHDPIDDMFRRRTYWLLLLTERAYAMERHRPLTLYGSIELPTEEEEPQEAHLISGFLALVNLYRLIDDDFMAIWNKAKSECSTQWLSQLQQQLAEILPPDLECTENQIADVRITQHWLRTMVWQLSITNGYLSSSSSDVAMTFKYPIYIARDLIKDVLRLSQRSMEVHGIGLIEKLFDVACTLTDVITYVPLENDPELPLNAAADYLNQLLTLISRLRGGSSKFQSLLAAKLSENLPSLTSSMHDVSSDPLQAYTPDQSTPSSISLPTLAPAMTNNSQQSQTQSPFGALSPFHEHSRGLMFDGYSPTLSHNSEMPVTPLTPPIGASPHGLFGTHPPPHMSQNLGLVTPRSVPNNNFTNTNGMKFEVYNG